MNAVCRNGSAGCSARAERDTASLLRAPEQTELRHELGPWLGQYEYDRLPHPGWAGALHRLVRGT